LNFGFGLVFGNGQRELGKEKKCVQGTVYTK